MTRASSHMPPVVGASLTVILKYLRMYHFTYIMLLTCKAAISSSTQPRKEICGNTSKHRVCCFSSRAMCWSPRGVLLSFQGSQSGLCVCHTPPRNLTPLEEVPLYRWGLFTINRRRGAFSPVPRGVRGGISPWGGGADRRQGRLSSEPLWQVSALPAWRRGTPA